MFITGCLLYPSSHLFSTGRACDGKEVAEAGAGAVAVASKVPISYVEFFGACSHDAVAASTFLQLFNSLLLLRVTVVTIVTSPRSQDGVWQPDRTAEQPEETLGHEKQQTAELLNKKMYAVRFGFHFHVISVAIREVLSAVPISYADFSQPHIKNKEKLRSGLWGQRFRRRPSHNFYFWLPREWSRRERNSKSRMHCLLMK